MLATLLALTLFPTAGSYGLDIGTRHSYVLNVTGEKPQPFATRVDKIVTVGELKVADLSTSFGPHMFLAVNEHGVFSFFKSNLPGTEMDTKTKPAMILVLGKEQGHTWKWVEEFRGQVMAGPDGKGPDMKKLRSYAVATLLELEAPIKVPAGEFKAIHVSIKRSSQAAQPTYTESWYSPEVGLVKEIVSYPGSVAVTELVK